MAAEERCRRCDGTGWLTRAGAGGLPVARRCSCRAERIRRSNRVLGLPDGLAEMDFGGFDRGDWRADGLAHRRLTAVANRARGFAASYPAGARGGLLFHGGPRGRLTHLAVATLRRLAERGFSCAYCDCATLAAAVHAQRVAERHVAIAAGRFVRRLADLDVVLLDGVGERRLGREAGLRLSALIRRRCLHDRGLLVATALPLRRAAAGGGGRIAAWRPDPPCLGERVGGRALEDLLAHCEALRVPAATFAGGAAGPGGRGAGGAGCRRGGPRGGAEPGEVREVRRAGGISPGPSQVGARHSGGEEIGAPQVGSGEVGSGEVGRAQVGLLQPR